MRESRETVVDPFGIKDYVKPFVEMGVTAIGLVVGGGISGEELSSFLRMGRVVIPECPPGFSGQCGLASRYPPGWFSGNDRYRCTHMDDFAETFARVATNLAEESLNPLLSGSKGDSSVVVELSQAAKVANLVASVYAQSQSK